MSDKFRVIKQSRRYKHVITNEFGMVELWLKTEHTYVECIEVLCRWAGLGKQLDEQKAREAIAAGENP